MESGAERGAKREAGNEFITRVDLAHRGRTEGVIVLVTAGSADRPVRGDIGFSAAIDGGVALAPGACLAGADPAVTRCTALRIGLEVRHAQLIGFLAVFGAARQGDRLGETGVDRISQVKVGVDFALCGGPEVKAGLRCHVIRCIAVVRAEREVQRVVHRCLDRVLAGRTRQVIGQLVHRPLDARHAIKLIDDAHENGGEASGIEIVEIGVLSRGAAIGVLTRGGLVVEAGVSAANDVASNVARLQGRAGGVENRVGRGAVVEAFLGVAVRGIGDHIEFRAVRDIDRGIENDLPAMAGRAAPDLCGQRVIRKCTDIAWVLRGIGHSVGARHAAAGLAVAVVFTRQVGEADVAQLEARVGGELIALAVAVTVILAIAALYFHAVVVVAQAIVHHTGDGVRAILRGGAITQNFEVLDRDFGDRADVRTLRTITEAGVTTRIDLHQCRSVEALAAQHDQRFVGRKAAQRRRVHKARRIRDRVLRSIERWHNVLDHIDQVGCALRGQVLAADDVDRRGRAGRGAVGTACADDDNILSLCLAGGGRILRSSDRWRDRQAACRCGCQQSGAQRHFGKCRGHSNSLCL